MRCLIPLVAALALVGAAEPAAARSDRPLLDVLARLLAGAPAPASPTELPAWTCCEGRVCPRSGPATRKRPTEVDERPNVLLIVADDLGWNDVGYHGSPIETPSIDALAREGVELDRFYTAPLCTPTRAALLTGRAALRSGLDYNVVRPWSEIGLPAEEVTIAEHFRDAGYQTALVGKWHLGHSRIEYLPNAQGFDEFFGFLLGLHDHYDHVRLDSPDWQHNGVTSDVTGYDTDVFTAHAAHWIETRERRRPFFLMLGYSAPHRPLQAPQSLIEKYPDLSDERSVHAAMVDAMDQGIGQVLDVLRAEGIEDDTIVVFMSDNGGVVGPSSNAPLRGGKGNVFEGGIRVPAVIRWPGRLPEGTVSLQRLREFDWLPTLADATGVPLDLEPERGLDGRSVWPMLADGTAESRDPFYFLKSGTGGAERGVLDDAWKFVWRRPESVVQRFLYPASSLPIGEGSGDDQLASQPFLGGLYELAADLWEEENLPGGLAGEDPEPVGWSPPRDWTDLVAGEDRDGDGASDACDVCPGVSDPDQRDVDADGRGDACTCGDANGNGQVDLWDAWRIRLCVLGRAECSARCDTNGDGTCDAVDARRAELAALGLLSRDALECAPGP